MIAPERLPTHVARVASRLRVTGSEASGDTFLVTSYLAESVLKTIAVTLCSGIRKTSEHIAYRLEYDLVRADGLGVWEAVIGTAVSHAYAGYVDQEMRSLVVWLTKKRTRADDEWAREAAQECSTILSLLGASECDIPKVVNVRHLVAQFVQIRNKTKAHGAVGADFFEEANCHYLRATQSLAENCPALGWDWYHLSVRPGKGTVRAVHLCGTDPKHVTADKAEALRPPATGVYFRTHDRGHLFPCAPLVSSNRECTWFGLPNGGFTDRGSAELIDYATGDVRRAGIPSHLSPPAALPSSATEGAPALDVYSNVFGNLPASPDNYVQRAALQDELFQRLTDRNHPIITLHGRGGIGKTSLALFVTHQLAAAPVAPFDHLLWFSARDLELRPTGPGDVRRGVPNLETVCDLVGAFFDIERTPDSLAAVLQKPGSLDSEGILFVFDNFETLDDPRGVHKFLDTHTHIPNKVLITSRERAFKGDYPIEVGGMEFQEARELLQSQSVALNIDTIVTASIMEKIIEYTDAHPYVMRVLLGEIAKDKRWVPLKSLVPRRGDLLDAVFERSFNRISTDGRSVFLTVSGWRAAVPELALLVVTGQRRIDVEAGIEECLRFSLLTRHELADGQFCYAAPELARLFARKKLEGDPDRLVIEEDLQVLRQFGTIKASEVSAGTIEEVTQTFLDWCLAVGRSSAGEQLVRLDATMVRVAELWPKAWLKVAELRRTMRFGEEKVSYAFRRAVEEMPYDKAVWQARAQYAGMRGDDGTRIACLVSAVEADPSDSELIRQVGYDLCEYIDAHKYEIPEARRGVYLASVRSHMVNIATELDPTGLSRLAWLFLLEGNLEGGWKYANMGLAKDSTNTHCLRIVERLESQGYRPPLSL